MHDHLVALGVTPHGIAPEDHGELLRADPHPAQSPQIVVVQGGGLDVDRRPTLGDLGFRALADLET